ncbi:MAG: glycosyltransferase family 39 protein [Rubrobacteraceae bacterium]
MAGASRLPGRLVSVVDGAPFAVALGGVLLLGTFLRFYQLGFESLWLDEGASIKIASMDPLRMIRQATADPTPPFYYLILHYWMALFGDSEFAVRSLSAIAGSLSIPVMYWVGALLFGRITGLLAAAILAVSELQIYYSQEVRVYSLFSLLALISFYFFIRIFQGKTGRLWLTGYVVSTVFLMYAHVYGIFVLAAQDLYLLTALLVSRKFGGWTRPSVKTWAVIHGAIAFLYIPGLLFLAGQITDPRGRAWVDEPGLPFLAQLPEYYSGSTLATLVFVTLAVLGIVRKTVSRGPAFAGRTYLLVAWLLALTALPFVVSKFSVVILGHPRHTIAASLAFYLLAAKGLGGLTSGAYRKPLALGAVALVVALSAPSLWAHYTSLEKPQWREATQYVKAHAGQNDLVIYRTGLLFDHYSQRADIEKERAFDDTPKTLLKGRDRVWMLLYGGETPPKTLNDELGESFRVTDRKEYRSLKLTLFQREPTDQP